jgi:hypothetical protein
MTCSHKSRDEKARSPRICVTLRASQPSESIATETTQRMRAARLARLADGATPSPASPPRPRRLSPPFGLRRRTPSSRCATCARARRRSASAGCRSPRAMKSAMKPADPGVVAHHDHAGRHGALARGPQVEGLAPVVGQRAHRALGRHEHLEQVGLLGLAPERLRRELVLHVLPEVQVLRLGLARVVALRHARESSRCRTPPRPTRPKSETTHGKGSPVGVASRAP